MAGLKWKIRQWLKNYIKLPLEKRYKSRYRIIYLGEGATERLRGGSLIRTERIFREEYAAEWQLMVRQAAFRYSRAKRRYRRKGAEFVGYYARRKDGVWKWYATDRNWYSSTEYAQNPSLKKRLFCAGDRIGEIDCGGSVYLCAQWRCASDKKPMPAGYDIFCHTLLAHALGGGQVRQTYANTLEALEESYRAGIRYFEVDVDVTCDGRMVLSHGWSERACEKTGMQYQPEFEQMTLAMFRQQTIRGMHTMDIRDLQQYMDAHPDTCFEIDFHRTGVADKVKVLLQEFSGREDLYERLLIQAGDQKIFGRIDRQYHFRHYQMILRPEWQNHLENGVIDFALEHGIETIAVRHALFQDFYVRLFHAAGLSIMVYTIQDDAKRAAELLNMGVDTVCTDFVTPKELREAGCREERGSL